MTVDFDLAETDRLLTTTKAVSRRFDLSRDVPIQLILDCIGIASAAPLGGNVEANRWIIVKDAAKKAALAEIYRAVGNPYLQLLRDRAEPGSRQSRVVEAGQYIADVLSDMPALVIPVRLGVAGDGAGVFGPQGFYGSVVPAVWSFQLAARSRGLGTRYTTYHVSQSAAVAEILAIAEPVTQIALIPVAYYTGAVFTPAPRRPPEQISYLDSWGANPIQVQAVEQ
jgi:nitroreductase